MTKKQKREYKLWNQRRKMRIQNLGKNGPKEERYYWAKYIGLIQSP